MDSNLTFKFDRSKFILQLIYFKKNRNQPSWIVMIVHTNWFSTIGAFWKNCHFYFLERDWRNNCRVINRKNPIVKLVIHPCLWRLSFKYILFIVSEFKSIQSFHEVKFSNIIYVSFFVCMPCYEAAIVKIK
jgi:hypothetical protein